MKKVVFFITLLISITIFSPCLATTTEQAAPQDFSIIDATCSPWDIPWKVSAEEFLPSVKGKHGLTFVPTETPLCYALSEPSEFYFMDEPVQRCHTYFAFPYYNIFEDDAVLWDFQDLQNQWQGVAFDFISFSENTDVKDGIAAFARLYDKLFVEYGSPLNTLLIVCGHSKAYPTGGLDGRSFCIPMSNNSIDQTAVLKPFLEPYERIALIARFDNYSLYFIATPNLDPTSHLLRLLVCNTYSSDTVQYPPYTDYVEFD